MQEIVDGILGAAGHAVVVLWDDENVAVVLLDLAGPCLGMFVLECAFFGNGGWNDCIVEDTTPLHQRYLL